MIFPGTEGVDSNRDSFYSSYTLLAGVSFLHRRMTLFRSGDLPGENPGGVQAAETIGASHSERTILLFTICPSSKPRIHSYLAPLVVIFIFFSELRSPEVIMKLGHKTLSFLSTTVFAAFLLISATAQAQMESYRARLSPMPTTPQTVTTITGVGEVFLTLNGNTLSIQGNFEGMSSAATMAHIHNGPPAQPGPVVHRLEVSASSEGEVSAELELTDEQITALRNNSLYIQIHSDNNPPGELRGWIFARN